MNRQITRYILTRYHANSAPWLHNLSRSSRALIFNGTIRSRFIFIHKASPVYLIIWYLPFHVIHQNVQYLILLELKFNYLLIIIIIHSLTLRTAGHWFLCSCTNFHSTTPERFSSRLCPSWHQYRPPMSPQNEPHLVLQSLDATHHLQSFVEITELYFRSRG